METERLRYSASLIELDVKEKKNLIKLYERQLGRVNDESIQFSQLHLLLHSHSKITDDGAVVIASNEVSTPPDSPDCSPPPSDDGCSSDDQVHNVMEMGVPKTLFSADFRIFKYRDSDLLEYIWPIFQSFELPDIFNVDSVKFASFIKKVYGRYQMKHYHCFRHAFDVLQTVSELVRQCTEYKLPDVHLLGLLIAALCHDIKHPGLTNAFLVKAKSPVALLYNGQSVLENFHAMSTIALLHERECDILDGLSPELREICEATIVECILWTDMSLHRQKISLFTEMIRAKQARPDQRMTNEDYPLFAAMLLKCSDVSNVWKPWKDSYQWSSMLLKEWLVQGDTEASLFGERSVGPKTALDPGQVSAYIGKNTAFFIGHYIEPMVNFISLHLPSLHTSFGVLSSNLSLYQRLEQGVPLADLNRLKYEAEQ